MRIVLSGGGTGGHITPLLAVAHSLRQLDSSVELIYIGEGSHMEEQLLEAAGLELHQIVAGKFRRYHKERLWRRLTDLKTLVLNTMDLVKFTIGVAQSLVLLRRLRPQVVFSKGGYVALPVGLAAALLRIPLVTHDSDVTPGLTNRLLGRFARTKACGFPRPGGVYTGNLVRADFLGEPAVSFKTSKPVVVFLGGSTGAHAINTLVFQALPELTKLYYVVHITGSKDFKAAPVNVDNYEAHTFIGGGLGGLLKAADVVVSRAGATALSELAALGKVSVLIPGAHLTGGQQLRNAEVFEKAGAALVLQEAGLNPRSLLAAIEQARASEGQFKAAIKQFYNANAAKVLAQVIRKAA